MCTRPEPRSRCSPSCKYEGIPNDCGFFVSSPPSRRAPTHTSRPTGNPPLSLARPSGSRDWLLLRDFLERDQAEVLIECTGPRATGGVGLNPSEMARERRDLLSGSCVHDHQFLIASQRPKRPSPRPLRDGGHIPPTV